MHLKNEVVRVTGGSRGIGAAIVKQLAYEGYRVAVNFNHSKQMAYYLCKEICGMGGKAMPYKADISNVIEVNNMFDEIESQLGHIDILINNAGISSRGLITDISEAEWDKVINTNLKGAFLSCKRALPYMINKKSGKIINISSVWGITGASYESLYATAKGGLITFSKSLAKELVLSGIMVNVVAPGPIETDLLNSELDKGEKESLVEEIPLGRLGRPEDVALICSYLLNEKAFITGQVITVDGGYII